MFPDALLRPEYGAEFDAWFLKDSSPVNRFAHILLLIGLPHSGKSMFAREIAATYGYTVVSADAIRLALHGQAYVQSAEPFVWAILDTMVKALIDAGTKQIVIDNTNNTVKRRKPFKKFGVPVYYKCFPTPPAECKDRLKKSIADPKLLADLIFTVDRMASEYEPVTEDEGLLEWESMTPRVRHI